MTREEEIFAQALALPPSERRAFLDRACADDPALRSRLGDLLTAHDQSERFLAGSLAARLHPVLEEQPGDTIGRYRLIRQLGEGGCGVVFLAEQTDPVRRLVALKIVKLGLSTREVVTRFEAERQALAVMDHPGIAHVYDAGATAQGRPYFAMEYVAGQPITKYCDEKQLSTAARLALFADVCLALQHAHHKGIVHRDVKPTNILVAEQDGRPAPKIIDFGIAKATQGRLTDATLLTALDQFIGTPSYMSPEQADLRTTDIDTRSDIYSLGVLLYELLTGHPPFDPKALVAAGVAEIRRIIREVEPPRPSTALSTLDRAERTTVAKRRAAQPERLTSVLRGDLDWIVMRCLEKDRARRYGTANELVEDIRRHLRSEPIVARPPSAAYRAQKFIRRHRVACASAAAIAAALVLGTVVSVAQAVRANRAEQDARRRQEEAESLLTFMLGDFRTGLKKIGQLELLDAVGQKAEAYYNALDPRDQSDVALTRYAKALTQIGEIRMDEVRYGDAHAAFTSAYRRSAALVARHPNDADMLFERAQAEYWIGFVARKRGDHATEREWFTRYRDSAVALAALEGPKLRAQNELAYGRHNLAVLDCDQGNLAAARAGFLAERTAVRALLASDPKNLEFEFRLADIASWLGTVSERDGDYAAAIAHFSEMSSRYRALAAFEPAVPNWRLQLARSLTFLGDVRALLGQSSDAQSSYARAKTLFDVLAAHDPKNRQWQRNALGVDLQQAALLLANGDPSASTPALRATREQLELLVKAEPSSSVSRRLLAAAWRLEAGLRLATSRRDAGVAAARALDLGEALLKEAPADGMVIGEYAQSAILAGRIALATSQPDVARRDWDRALGALAPRLAASNDWRFLDPAAQAFVLLGKTDEARPLIERLRRFGYHPRDPLAAPILGPAPSPVSPNQKP